MTGTGDYAGWLSMRDLDDAAGLPKGTAFRAFKRLLGGLEEGRDFVVLDLQAAQALVAALIDGDRLYRSSVHPVLLAPAAAAQVRMAMAALTDR